MPSQVGLVKKIRVDLEVRAVKICRCMKISNFRSSCSLLDGRFTREGEVSKVRTSVAGESSTLNS